MGKLYPQIDKAWGTSRLLYLDEQVELARINILAGGFCSPHLHRHKANIFQVLTGTLIVRHGPTMIECCLDASTSRRQIEIPAGVMHQFEALTDVLAYEIYTSLGSPIDPADIERHGEGGIRKCPPQISPQSLSWTAST